MRYVLARMEEENRAETYRFYVTDVLQAIAHNTASIVAGGLSMNKRYFELLHNEQKQEADVQDEISVEEVVDKIWSKIESGDKK